MAENTGTMPGVPEPTGGSLVGRGEADFDRFYEEARREVLGGEETEEASEAASEPEEPTAEAGKEPEEGKEQEAKEEVTAEEEGKAEAKKTEAEEGEQEPASEETSEQQAVDDLIQLLTNPDLLEVAIRQAGVDKISELPSVKDLIGRVEQSTRDRLLNEISRAEYERQNVERFLDEARKGPEELAEMLDKAAKAIEEGESEIALPDKETILKKFQDYADAVVHAYHNQQFGNISELLFSYPELQAMTDEQRQYLGQVAGADPSTWMNTVYEIARNNLWMMAQMDVAERAQQAIEDQRKLLEAAHKEEVKKLTERYEREMKKAIEKAKEEARAEAFAELASKAPPRETPKESSPASGEEEDWGSSIEEIWHTAKQRLSRGASV
jgi:hypothetical protein